MFLVFIMHEEVLSKIVCTFVVLSLFQIPLA